MKRDLAMRIADILFKDGTTLKRAKRLALVHSEGPTQYMAGWCKGAVIGVIRKELTLHTATE